MSASSRALAALDRHLAIIGQPVTLRRYIDTASNVVIAVDCFAIVRGGTTPSPLLKESGIIEEGQTAVISPTEPKRRGWPWPPLRGDFLVISGIEKAIEAVEVIPIAGDDVRANLRLKG